jgi:iron-sulfur cluster repair protein YtfE (RIC family)
MHTPALNNILVVPTLLKCDNEPDIHVCITWQDLATKIMPNKLDGTTSHNYIYLENNILFFDKQQMLTLMVHHHQLL